MNLQLASSAELDQELRTLKAVTDPSRRNRKRQTAIIDELQTRYDETVILSSTEATRDDGTIVTVGAPRRYDFALLMA